MLSHHPFQRTSGNPGEMRSATGLVTGWRGRIDLRPMSDWLGGGFPGSILSWMLLLTSLCATSACVTKATPTVGYPNQRAIVTMSKAALLACAGPPVRETSKDGRTILAYYQHPGVFDRSNVASKSSLPVPHYGCWATVVLNAHHIVTDVHYRSVPEGTDAADQCEAIFDPCT